MKSPGSVLIVVLGLLAILAVVGITFVTMSSLDRSTASNFAVQGQFMLAADGAIAYVSHHLVQDVWEFDPSTKIYKDKLLSDGVANIVTASVAPYGLTRNEPFDFPGTDESGKPVDPWLATSFDDDEFATYMQSKGQYSYETTITANTAYGLSCWGRLGITNGEQPNNLGFPGSSNTIPMYSQGKGHAVWIPDLSFPFQAGVIRVSVTVQDHAAMLNVNAHGNNVDPRLKYGYFISDVDPSYLGSQIRDVFEIQYLLQGRSVSPYDKVLGLWAMADAPGNPSHLAAVIENPAKFLDTPFTLDEEFELRRLSGTYFRSRLELLASSQTKIMSDPSRISRTPAQTRMLLTTVGWVSEVQPDTLADNAGPPTNKTDAKWSARKVDINIDEDREISLALQVGRAFDKAHTNLINQFTANICAFRDGADGEPLKQYAGAGSKTGASRQPVISKAGVDGPTSAGGDPPMQKWTLNVQLVSPWPGNRAGGAPGLSTKDITLDADGGDAFTPEIGDVMTGDTAHNFESTVEAPQGTLLTTVLKSITLKKGALILDRIGPEEITRLAEGSKAIHRKIYIQQEQRGPDPAAEKVRVVYFGPWEDNYGPGGKQGWGASPVDQRPEGAIPIRFPRSVQCIATSSQNMPKYGYPPYPMTVSSVPDKGFKAFARIGDLNQVLCPVDEQAATDFWPWISRVAASSGEAAEATVKFNWKDQKPTGTNYSRMNAMNTLCVGGPWLDKIDNDGDGYADEDGGGAGSSYGADWGEDLKGRFGGPELRVAGKINLNTATKGVLEALEKSFGIPEGDLADAVIQKRNTQSKGPFRSPAELLDLLPKANFVSEDAKGELERRDLSFTRLSNIVSVRSDTFSIYGTVQYIDPTLMRSNRADDRLLAVRRSRRFWALVDRSPSLAYWPRDMDRFSRPRILNFQWMD